MKRFLLTTCLILILVNCFSQETVNTEKITARFIKYYNADQADSLYTLFSDEVKKGLPLSQMPPLVSQLKSQLGKLLRSEYAGADKGIETYICDFEKSDQVLHLHFDKDNKVAGFYVNADKRVKTPVSQDEAEISVNTNNAVLKGTLSVPKVSGKMPVILLIAGSGPTDRNGNSTLIQGMPNYFLKISDELRANNIAVLRYDKRGIGQSTTSKSEAESTFDDMVDDAVTLIKFLKGDERFSEIIVCGHSEGSLIGMLASQKEEVDGFISLAGPGFPISDILASQFKEALAPSDYQTVIAVLDTIKAGKEIRQSLKNGLETHFRPSIRAYLHSWMKYSPKNEIAKLTIPVLIVQGTHDIQVDVANASELKKANPKAKLILIDGMNHILKEAPADKQLNIATYSKGELALHPQLIDELRMFTKSVSKRL